MKAKVGISLTSDILRRARVLSGEQGITLSGLISTLIYREFNERALAGPKIDTKPVGRPRHSAEEKQITRWIERAERFPIFWMNELRPDLFEAMFGRLQAKLRKAIEERDGATLKVLAEGHEWEETRVAYFEEEERNVNS